MSETVLSVILESLMTLYLFTSRDVKIRVGGLNNVFTLSAAHGVSPSRQCTVLCIIQGINQCSCFEDVAVIMQEHHLMILMLTRGIHVQ